MHRWKYSALAAAAVAFVGLHSPDAHALALGPITVQSALGEPLRAEIDLPEITSAEAESLRASTAPVETFRAQGMEYSPTVNQMRVQLQRRPDGRTVLRLSGDRPVNDPFVDLVINATWSAGRITRSYTMLFDPPALRRAPATVTAPAQIAASAAPARAAVAATAPPAPRAPVVPRTAPAPVPTTADAVPVKVGDTAGRIASVHRPAGVSLDQMLVAMMQANPDAFIQGNVNRLKAGVVLQMPDEAQALATPAAEARQILAVQSRDFNEFRRKLAGMAPSAALDASSRSASGTVQTRVEEKTPASTAPDKLTLSKGAVQGQKATEDLLAKRKQANEAAARVEELSKNITELNKLNAAPIAAAPASASEGPAMVMPGVTAPATSATVAPAASTPAMPTASEPTTAASEAAPIHAEPVAVAASTPAAPAPQPAPATEPGFLADLLHDPLVPWAGGGLLALLAGYGAYRVVQRRRNGSGVDSSFLESRVPTDSFFGASGGQRVDTADSETHASSIAYSHSQLDTGGDVDPVAEADVYLAYGRDLQAEEILREAVRQNPARIPAHVKLAEIYAKRQDRKAFEAVATDVHKATQGEGSDWNRIVDLGCELDPQNPLYQPGGSPLAAVNEIAQAAAAEPEDFVNTIADEATPEHLPPDIDLDLDIELSNDALTDAPTAAAGAFAAAAAAATTASEEALSFIAQDSSATPVPYEAPQMLSMPDFDGLATQSSWSEPAPSAAVPDIAPPPMAEIDFPMDLPSLEAAPVQDETAQAPQQESVAPSDPGLLEFDLGGLSLDLDTPSAPAPLAQETPSASESDGPEVASSPEDQLDTKLALAQEFNTIGDSDGARTLIEEVIAESSGALKARAQRMLSELG